MSKRSPPPRPKLREPAPPLTDAEKVMLQRMDPAQQFKFLERRNTGL
jgi:hypothetical protein